MPRRRKYNGNELLELGLKLSALLILLSLVSSSVRNFAFALGGIVVFVFVFLLVLLFCFIIYKIVKGRQKNRNKPFDLQEFVSTASSWPSPVPAIQPAQTEIPPAINLSDKLREIDWFQFEKLVALIYERRGFTVSRRGGANPDGGVDLILGLEDQRWAVQCKQWKTWNVGVKAVREFLGALTDSGIGQGIFITLNGYTGEAKQLAEKHGIQIINETGLTAMMDEARIKDDPVILEILSDTRKFCPKCERLMVERVSGKGPNPGQRFWGCSGYPRCRFTMPI